MQLFHLYNVLIKKYRYDLMDGVFFSGNAELLSQLKIDLTQFRHDMAKAASKHENDRKMLVKRLTDVEERLDSTKAQLSEIMTSCGDTHVTLSDNIRPDVKDSRAQLQQVRRTLDDLANGIGQLKFGGGLKLNPEISNSSSVQRTLDTILDSLRKLLDLEGRLEDAREKLAQQMATCYNNQMIIKDAKLKRLEDKARQRQRALVASGSFNETDEEDDRRPGSRGSRHTVSPFTPIRHTPESFQGSMENMANPSSYRSPATNRRRQDINAVNGSPTGCQPREMHAVTSPEPSNVRVFSNSGTPNSSRRIFVNNEQVR